MKQKSCSFLLVFRPLLLVLVWVLVSTLAFLGQLWSSICTCLIIVPCLGIPSICLLVVVGGRGYSLPLFRFLLVFVFVFTSLFSLQPRLRMAWLSLSRCVSSALGPLSFTLTPTIPNPNPMGLWSWLGLGSWV